MLINTWEWIRLLGFLAYFYFTVSIVFGLLRKSPYIKSNKNILYQIHQFAGWMGFFTVIAHMLVLIIDEYEPYTIGEILIPFSSDYQPFLSGLGTIGFYFFLSVIMTSDIWIRTMNRSIWKTLHMFVFPAWVISLAHGVLIGTDSENLWILLFYGATVSIVAITLLLRLISAEHKKKEEVVSREKARDTKQVLSHTHE